MSSDEQEEILRAPHGQAAGKLGHKKQKFRKEWLSINIFKNWLQPVINNPLKAYCCYCKVEFVTELTTVKKHALSTKHKTNAISVTNQKSVASFFENPNNIKTKKTADAIKSAEIKICGFLSEHNISFNTVDHLSKLMKDLFPKSEVAQGIKLGRTKATCVVKNVIGKIHKEDMVNNLKSIPFSVIIDESTDVGTLKTLCICVRYFNTLTNKIETKLWSLVELFRNSDDANKGATAIHIYTEVINSFTSENVPLNNIIGFASDGCNTMMGSWNSVSSNFKNDLPGIFIQKCICHSLALCASESCKVLPRKYVFDKCKENPSLRYMNKI